VGCSNGGRNVEKPEYSKKPSRGIRRWDRIDSTKEGGEHGHDVLGSWGGEGAGKSFLKIIGRLWGKNLFVGKAMQRMVE